ncbi:hypothetical protein AAHE18_11G200600 [Arachis hypogaea]
MTRNHVGSARAGTNPAVHVIFVTLTNLIPNAYALCRFHSITNPNTFSYTFSYDNLIRIHTLHNFVALRRLSLTSTPSLAFKACSLLHSSSFTSISIALSLHSQALKLGFLADPFSLNALRCVCSLHRRVHGAHKLFNESSHRDVVSYNAMVHGFVKSGEITRERELFDEMLERDSVSWGTMIAGYGNAKLCYEAIHLFNEMIGLGIRPDNIALVNVLSACAQTGELDRVG